MTRIRELLEPTPGRKPRLAIFLSGGGSNAERILQRVAAAGGAPAPLDVVCLVTDAPETSRALEIGRAFGLPVVANDIHTFYREHGEARVSIATPKGQELRAAWTDRLRRDLAAFKVDFAVFAGFVPLTNLTGDFPCLNVHPGDLTWLKDGRRYLVGLHTVPIERAILEGLESMCSSVIQAMPYSGTGDDMDSGPILGISAPVDIDLDGAALDELRRCRDARPASRPKGGWGDRLERVAMINQERLKRGGDWIVLPPVVFDFARGRFGIDETGTLHYRIGARWHPITTVVYGPDERELLFASSGLQ